MNERGGKRRGAGRPKGAKGKATVAREAAMRERGIDALTFLQEVYANKKLSIPVRVSAATSALPYEYSKKPIEARIESAQAVHVQIVDFTAATVLAELEGEEPDMIDVTPTNSSNGAVKPSTEGKLADYTTPTVADLLR